MPENNRRQFVKLAASAGAIGTLGLAGCLGEDDDGNGDNGNGGDGGNGNGGDGNGDGNGGNGNGDGNGGNGNGEGENYPEQEINVVIPFGAGGGTDTQFRGIQEAFEEELGVSTVPDNRPGASGRTGFNDLWRMEGDGYNIGCISVLTGTMGQVLYDTEYDLREGGKIGISTAQFFCLVAESGRFEGAEDFANWAAEADEIVHGSVGLGSSGDFVGKASLDAVDANMDNVTTVAYDEGSAGAAGAARGEVDFASIGELGAVSLKEEGDIDVLWVARPDGSEVHPDSPVAPDVAETLGVEEMPDYGLELGFFGPEGFPDYAEETLEEALLNAVEYDEVQEFAEEQGLAIMGWGRDELSDRIDTFVDAAERYDEIVDLN